MDTVWALAEVAYYLRERPSRRRLRTMLRYGLRRGGYMHLALDPDQDMRDSVRELLGLPVPESVRAAVEADRARRQRLAART
jgi:hypothetical protein